MRRSCHVEYPINALVFVSIQVKMANGFLAWDILVLQERVRQLERRVKRRMLRDTQDPFQLPHDEFMETFRVSPELALEIVAALRPDLERQRISGLSPEIQVINIHTYIFEVP